MSKITTIKLGNGDIITKYHNSTGLLHREDGPSVITNFSEEWWKNGKLHRHNGPAIFINKSDYIRAEWWINGILHRENNKPAVIDSEGNIEYWEDGQHIK
jgi:hypothetical protein